MNYVPISIGMNDELTTICEKYRIFYQYSA